jgi:hypothetical protein
MLNTRAITPSSWFFEALAPPPWTNQPWSPRQLAMSWRIAPHASTLSRAIVGGVGHQPILGYWQASWLSAAPPCATPHAAPLCARAWVPRTLENKNSDIYRVANVNFMTLVNSATSTFVNRKDNWDSLAKEPAPTLDSTLGRIFGLLLGRTAVCVASSARAILGRWVGSVAADLFSFLRPFPI